MEKEDQQEARTKSREFAAAVAGLYRHLAGHKKETVLSERLLRSGAGVGAHLARAGCALNAAERVARLGEALQDCAEAKYWLEVLNDGGYLTEFEFNGILERCDALGKLLVGVLKRGGAAPATPAGRLSSTASPTPSQ